LPASVRGSASKFTVAMLIHLLAAEYAPKKVRIVLLVQTVIQAQALTARTAS
jgi:NAD(P)-dependent dehydrogenase (short-subunit alcohol dehydrogenase family)